LISGISQGVTDLYKQPKLGFKKGHLQGIFGIAKGSGKLIQNTFHGTFGFIDNLTSNISKGILSLGHDDEYMQKRARNQIKEKPNNVIKGLGYGFKSFSKGLIYGVSDIVRQPIKSLKEDKSIKGFGKGLLKGIGGMITKPVSGAIDLVSKTTEGIQNTVKKTETEEQIRDRRALYGKLKVIKVYNADHAIVVDKLSVAKKKIISCLQDEFVDVFDYTNNNKQMSYLIVTHTKLVSLNLDFTKIEEEIPVKDIKNIKKDNSTLIFEYKRAGISTIKTCETNEKLDWIIKKIKKCLHI
jgi:vacuolar protein sorting-associated protein 13A/C